MNPTASKSVTVALHMSGDSNETDEDVTADKKDSSSYCHREAHRYARRMRELHTTLTLTQKGARMTT